jgi:hypothetical protein
VSGDRLRHPLATREGWAAFVSRSRPEPPRLLPADDLERLDAAEREIYDDARMDYHSELLLVATPDIRKITTTGAKLIVSNRGKQLGRRGLIVSGPSGTGKSTSITQLGKIHHVETERRSPGTTGPIPVVYIIVPRPPPRRCSRSRSPRSSDCPSAATTASTPSPSPSPACCARSGAA